MTPQLYEAFMTSPWYANLIYVLFNLNTPLGITKTKAIFLKLKAIKFCIIENVLYWKDVVGLLLKCLLSDVAERNMEEFHEGDYGGHLYWKTTANKILRVVSTGLHFFQMSIKR